MTDATFRLGSHEDAVERRLGEWENERTIERLWQRDPTVWSRESPPPPELVDRLGWLDLPRESEALVAPLEEFAAGVAETAGRVVLLGMGGSSLAPEMLSRTFGASRLPLDVLDTTHPDAVRRSLEGGSPAGSFFLVSSKSGTTLETLSLFRAAWSRAAGTDDGETGSRFAAVTDPGSPLALQGRRRGFREVFEANPAVGGRFSALSAFGLVPAALVGLDLGRLLESARAASRACREPAGANPGARLGAALGELARAGRDKVTFLTTPRFASFPAWAEQLLAESTGKEGTGIVPVADEPLRATEAYGDDRFFVALHGTGEDATELRRTLDALAGAGHPIAACPVADAYDLAAQFFVWEIAVALAGAVLEIHPFDQPDVQLAKDLAKEAMAEGGTGAAPEPPPEVDARAGELVAPLSEWLQKASAGDYVALHAYLAPTAATSAALEAVRATLGARTGLATTLGYGPRFLHSTGQLHKGGPNTGLFLQIVDEPREDLPVPESRFTFGELIRAQAIGDYRALVGRGRRVLRVSLGRDADAGLERLRLAVGR